MTEREARRLNRTARAGSKKADTFVIAAGGTGGHMFPAEALAAVLRGRGERVVFLVDARSSPKVAGCEVFVIPGAGVAGRSFTRAMAGLWAIAKGVAAARKILKHVGPSVVVGFGGYPAVAPVLAAKSLGATVVLHDQNAVLGRANAMLARIADGVAASFPGMKGVLTGNPVRPAICARAGAEYQPPAEEIRIVVFGGSLGARVFATLIPGAMALLPAPLRARILLTMQCPAGEIETARTALEACGVRAELAPFFEDVAGLMAGAHLLIARAGGSTVAEIAVIGRPAVLIPLTINQDQRANAKALANAGGAVVVEQGEGAAALARNIEALLNAPETLKIMAAASARMGIVDAAERLADIVVGAKR